MAQDTRFAAATVPHLKTLTRSEREAAAAGSATMPSPERRHHRVATSAPLVAASVQPPSTEPVR